MRLPAACALALAALLAPESARAFCRTTTDHEPVPYDPVVSGCWTQGAPLAWAGGQSIPYQLSAGASAQISLADATNVAHLAFEAWNQAQCNGGSPNVQTYAAGPVSPDAASTDCGLQMCDPSVHDGQHLIVFDDAFWPHNDPNQTLALTTVTYGVTSGEIFDADIEVNTFQHTITAQEPPPAGTYDLQAILTHEAGHFLGLAHATSHTPIMYAQYQPGAVTLTADDVNGICSIYQPTPTHGCSCTSAPARSGAWALATAFSLAALLGARRRRRASR